MGLPGYGLPGAYGEKGVCTGIVFLVLSVQQKMKRTMIRAMMMKNPINHALVSPSSDKNNLLQSTSFSALGHRGSAGFGHDGGYAMRGGMPPCCL